jgi:hypothetical protein
MAYISFTDIECLIVGSAPLVKWVPCHHGMARPQVADGGDGLQVWRVAANILNKQSRRADKEWYSSFIYEDVLRLTLYVLFVGEGLKEKNWVI